jgi:hypothetical protein
MIIITILRLSVLVNEGRVDTPCEVYWLVLGGGFSIFVAAATIFRSFFVIRRLE